MMTPIPPAVARHYHGARRACEKEQADVLLRHLIALLLEIMHPTPEGEDEDAPCTRR